MKKIILSIYALATFMVARADEGMWIPMLIGKNYDEMVRMGLKLSKEDLYSINNSSLKDAIVQFGGGCTAEMISGNGLLLTNHHCGYDAIAGLSSVEKNYLDNGFWAKNRNQEIPAPGLTVIFLQRMEDVTREVMEATGKTKGDEFSKRFDEVRKKIEAKASENGKYVANVKEFFNGNQYFLLIYKRYTDVRLVGTPPKSLGKFGGDTDNWMWPRHTADFSMFRVYAGPDNEPAAYSPDNKPFKPRKFLPVSIRGVKENDYTMTYGYPGRTNRYEISKGLEVALSDVNPSIVNIRDKRLAIMRKHMDADKSVYLKMTSRYASIANYWKYY
ncbi:MAG: serine protease, partial [Sphingobacteriales bacterium]